MNHEFTHTSIARVFAFTSSYRLFSRFVPLLTAPRVFGRRSMSGADRPTAVGSAFPAGSYGYEVDDDEYAEAGIVRSYAGGRYRPVNSTVPPPAANGGVGGGYRGDIFGGNDGGRRQQLKDDGEDRYANLVFDKNAAEGKGDGNRDGEDDDIDDDDDDDEEKPPSSGWVENILFVVCFAFNHCTFIHCCTHRAVPMHVGIPFPFQLTCILVSLLASRIHSLN